MPVDLEEQISSISIFEEALSLVSNGITRAMN